MADEDTINEPLLTGAQLTLMTTPTGGASGEHSPYYRRLLSAGYKGFLQGVIGGATLYGVIGTVLGCIVAAPVAMFAGGAVAAAAWGIVPVMGVLGLIKGADTFGNIGSVAAINAETAETSERRRYLLDRYYALPNDPAYTAEAKQIRKMLSTEHETHPPLALFHWKTMAICAVLGAVLVGGVIAFAPAVAVEALAFAAHLAPALGSIHLMSAGGAVIAGTAATATAVGAGIGGLVGGMIGLDRYYVRKWFDTSEHLLSDDVGNRHERLERAREVGKLEELSPDNGVPKQTVKVEVREPNQQNGTAQVVIEENGHKPNNRVNTVQLDARIAHAMAAMARPTV